MRRLLTGVFYPTKKFRTLSENYDAFLSEYLEINLNHLYKICFILTLTELLLLILPERAFSYHQALIIFLVINVTLLILLHIVKKNYHNYSNKVLVLLEFAIIANILLLATSLNLSSIPKTDYIHPYIIALTFIAIGLQLSPIALTSFALITAASNLIGMFLLQPDKEVFFTGATNIIVFVFVSWILGILVSRTRFISWLDHREIIAQNAFLEDLAKRDPMTRFFNHESIIGHLKQQIDIASVSGKPLSVLILDVDDFKRINDTFGHLKGDEVLLMIAKQINLSVRVSDIIGRYGGEEFFVIFPQTAIYEAAIIAERIRNSIEEAGRTEKITVTLSGGLALYEGGTTDDIIRQADNCLYEAKKTGKNKIITAQLR